MRHFCYLQAMQDALIKLKQIKMKSDEGMEVQALAIKWCGIKLRTGLTRLDDGELRSFSAA